MYKRQDLYGGTVNLFKNTLRQQGIEVRFADPADPKNFEKVTDDKTRAYYGETLPNPYLRVFPIKEVSDIGRKKGIPLIIDNTIKGIPFFLPISETSLIGKTRR